MKENLDLNDIIEDLVQKGWSARKGFIDQVWVERLFQEEKAFFSNGNFRKAGIGQKKEILESIRGDNILWLHEEKLSEAENEYWQKLMELKTNINRTLYLNLKNLEAHYAIFPQGAFYQRHYDQFKNNNKRQISCILYLNKEWKYEYGGQLRIYHPEGDTLFTDILPEEGLFVCFVSSEIEHEVLKTNKDRYSITGWFRN